MKFKKYYFYVFLLCRLLDVNCVDGVRKLWRSDASLLQARLAV